MWEYNYICHHGIKGQKWGIRRYQNKDGSLTPAGLRRQAKLQKQLDELSPKDKTQNETENKTAPKKVSDYSNDELRAMTDRLKAENAYKQELENASKFVKKNPESIKKGRDWLKTLDNLNKAAASISGFTTQGIQIYNNYARTMNGLVEGSNRKYIPGINQKDKKKED